MSDYLWDRSGEPDPEIKELEETLSVLRYQPRPLRLSRPKTPFKVLWLAAAALILSRALHKDLPLLKAPEVAT